MTGCDESKTILNPRPYVSSGKTPTKMNWSWTESGKLIIKEGELQKVSCQRSWRDFFLPHPNIWNNDKSY